MSYSTIQKAIKAIEKDEHDELVEVLKNLGENYYWYDEENEMWLDEDNAPVIVANVYVGLEYDYIPKGLKVRSVCLDKDDRLYIYAEDFEGYEYDVDYSDVFTGFLAEIMWCIKH